MMGECEVNYHFAQLQQCLQQANAKSELTGSSYRPVGTDEAAAGIVGATPLDLKIRELTQA